MRHAASSGKQDAMHPTNRVTRLEDLLSNATVQGILPDQSVTVISVQWFGSEALELTYKMANGHVANRLLYRADEPRLQVVEHGRPWSFDGDGHLFRLFSEAHRIRLAHLFDPVLAVHTSLVEPLPHHITAVFKTFKERLCVFVSFCELPVYQQMIGKSCQTKIANCAS
jgi:hypothetical protein